MGNDGEEVGCSWGFGAAVVYGGVEEFLGLVWVVWLYKLSAVLGYAALHPTYSY